MDYFPFENFEIYTTLNSDEIFYRFRAAIETKKTWWKPLFAIKKSYYGVVNRNSFWMVRVATLARNFTPEVSGTIRQDVSGSFILISMRLSSLSLVFWSFFLGTFGYLFFSRVANLISEMIKTGLWQMSSLWKNLPLLGMFIFGYLLVMVSFKVEADHIKDFLLKLTDAKNENIRYKDKFFGLTEFQIIKRIFLVVVIAISGWIIYNLI